MKITDIHVEGFGVWTDYELNRLSDGATVVYGPNEAGKTTLMQFLRAVLYGFSGERRLRYLPPVNGGTPGGVVCVCDGDDLFEVHRTVSVNDPPGAIGEVAVSTSDGARLGPKALETLLGHVDEATFNNVFAIGLHELQGLSTLDDTAAAEELYKLTSGLDRVSLADVIGELAVSRRRLLDSGGGSHIARLLERRNRLQDSLNELADETKRWTHLAAERHKAELEIARIQEESQGQQEQARTVELALQVRPSWVEREQVAQQLALLGPLPPLPARASERLKRYEGRIRKRRKQLAALKRRRAELRDEASEEPINHRLWALAPRIEAIGEHAQWIASLENQIERLTGEVESLGNDLDVQCEALGLEGGAPASSIPNLSRHTLGMLRGPARAMREHSTRVKQSKQESEAARTEVEEAALELETALAERKQPDLAAALDKAGSRVSQLRRRLQLQDRLEQMERRRHELEERSQELFERQMAPKGLLISVGAMVALGAALVFVGIVCWFYAMSGAMLWSALGLLLAGGALAAKVGLERSSASQMRTCSRQLDLLRKQIEEAQQEREELDHALPRGGGPWETQLSQGEAELRALEELLPLNARRQAAQERREAAHRRAVESQKALDEARRQWRNALRSLGLPETISPKHLRQLADSGEQAAGLRRRLEARRDELEQRERELKSIAGRIAQLLREAGLAAANDEPQQQLRQLSMALTEQQQLMERRASLQRRGRRLRRSSGKLMQSIDQLRRRRRAFMTSAGAASAEEFHRLAEKQSQASELIRRRDELSQQIANALGQQCSEQEIAATIARCDAPELERRWEQLAGRWDEWRSRLDELHTRKGELAHEMKLLGESRRCGEIQLELDSVEQQLRDAVHRWRVLATTELLLEAVRTRYEAERQPEALRDASTYLDQISEGQYTRVWTPLDERALCVDDADGRTLRLDVLSRGAREAVFLSLRLALVSAFARRGIVLPLVLDDVLVNLDARRAAAAVRMLRDFAAEGRQVLLFTCHEHIMKMFKSAKVEVRLLPERGAAPVADEWIEDEEEEEVVEAEAEVEVEADFEEVEEEYDEDDFEDEEDEGEDEEYEEEDDEEYEEEEAAEADDEEEYEYEEAEAEFEEDDDFEIADADSEEEEEELVDDADQEGADEEEAADDYELAEEDEYELAEEYSLAPEPSTRKRAKPVVIHEDDAEVVDELFEQDDPENGFSWPSPERWSNKGQGDAAA